MAQRRWPLPPDITERIIELLCQERRYDFSRRVYGVAGAGGAPHVPQPGLEPDPPRRRRPDRVPAASDIHLGGGPRRGAGAVGAEVNGDFETAEETTRNSTHFSETLRLFFNIFSQWTPGSNASGISLHITAFSPSDVDRCSKTDEWRRRMEIGNHDIFAGRYIHSILRLLPGPGDLPVVESVLEVILGKARHISASAWALIINSLPNIKKININFWENEKKVLELRRRLRDEIGDGLAQMRCPNVEVELTCGYKAPKDTPVSHRYSLQLKRLFLSDAVISPEMFYAVASGEWPHLEQFEITYAAVTQHGTWLLEFNPEDSPVDRPSPVVDLEEFTQDSLAIEVPAPEDLYEYSFRTRPVADEMDPIHRGLARAVQRMPALKEVYLVTWDVSIQWNHRYHAFLYSYNASKGVTITHWGSLPGYTPAEEVVELWKEMAEVRGIQLEILINENEV